ncbi:MAG: substrate-binding domain-containing protein [Bacteroidaceae bacterium]|nr:substrate-binding domain-containing protein [Bacteroidaceae bacterium]
MIAKQKLIILFSIFPIFSCYGDNFIDTSFDLKDISVNNFPIIDGSDSTSPLRYILMCKLLGFDYEWQSSPFIQNPEEAPKQVEPIFTCSEDEARELLTKRLLNSNTHQSFMNLIDDKVEVIITARSISRDEKAYADEQGVTLIEKPIAKDALAFMVNPKNPINNLSIEEIQGIYTGDIVNWSEVGGLDCVIKPYIRNRNSGSQEKFELMVMAGLTIKDFPEMQIGKTMMTPYYQLEQDTAGIAFTPFYYYNVMVGSGSTKAIGVNDVAMTKANIKNGTYPYTSNVYTAVRSDIDKSSVAYSLFEFLTSEEGQAIVDESGYVSLQTASTGIRSLGHEAIRMKISDNTITFFSSNPPQKIEIYDLNGEKKYQSLVHSRFIKIPFKLCGLHIITLIGGNNDVVLRQKVLL